MDEIEKPYQIYVPAFTLTNEGKIALTLFDGEDEASMHMKLNKSTGLKDWGSLKLLASDFLSGCYASTQEDKVNKLNAFFADFREFKPRDASERKLFLQMALVQEQVLHAFERCKRSTDDDYEKAVNVALKLLRIYNNQMEVLHKYRDVSPSVTANLIANNAIVGGVVQCN